METQDKSAISDENIDFEELIQPLSDFYLPRERTAILIIDIQERLVPAMTEGTEVVKQAAVMLEAAAVLNLPVFLTEQYPKGLGPTVLALEKRLEAVAAQKFEKITYTALIPELRIALEEQMISHVLVCGMETHVCVWQTVRDLLSEAYAVHVLSDVVCSRKKREREVALEGMRSMGAVISCSETALFDLLGQAATPEFKAISQLIK